jgi:NAD-dependent dihydropyrimidine dehydrogenase PreA subunit
MIVVSWLFPRAAHWTLDRGGIRGHFGATLLASESDEDEDDESGEAAEKDAADDKPRVGPRDLPKRTIYHLQLTPGQRAEPILAEIKRIRSESQVKTVDLMGWIGGAPKAEQLNRFVEPAPGNVDTAINNPVSGSAANNIAGSSGAGDAIRITEVPGRRWYPVIDYSRCTNCMECIDFCLFGVYGVDRAETILVEQPDNCRKGCPACSRVCPENAIIFPQHKTPGIAGSDVESAGGLKIDLSQLFGAPSAIEIAAQERDVELVATGRDAVGLSVGIPKRQADKPSGPKDELDKLLDQLDDLDL